jgi:hypothetical protein
MIRIFAPRLSRSKYVVGTSFLLLLLDASPRIHKMSLSQAGILCQSGHSPKHTALRQADNNRISYFYAVFQIVLQKAASLKLSL